MFDFHGFLMRTIKGMIHNYPDWQVQEYALGWYQKGKLTEDDLAEIDSIVNPPILQNDEDTLEDSGLLDDSTV